MYPSPGYVTSSPLLHSLSHSLLCCHPLPQAPWTRFEHQHVVKRNTREANSPEVQRKNQLNLVTVTESRIHDLLTLRYINNWMSTKTCFVIIIVISLGRILWVFGMISSHFSTAHTHCPTQSHTTVQDILPPCRKTTNTLLTTFTINVWRLFPSFLQPQHINPEHCVALSHTPALLQQLFMYRVALSATISSELLHVI